MEKIFINLNDICEIITQEFQDVINNYFTDSPPVITKVIIILYIIYFYICIIIKKFIFLI